MRRAVLSPLAKLRPNQLRHLNIHELLSDGPHRLADHIAMLLAQHLPNDLQHRHPVLTGHRRPPFVEALRTPTIMSAAVAGTTSRPEIPATKPKRHLPPSPQNASQSLDSIPNPADSVRPRPTPTPPGLRDEDPARGQRTPAPVLDVRGELVEHPGNPVLLDVTDRGPVDAGRAVVGAHRLPRPLQDVSAVDLVIGARGTCVRDRPRPGRAFGSSRTLSCLVVLVLAIAGTHRPFPMRNA